MNRAQRRSLAKSEDPKTREAAAQAKAMMLPARMGHIVTLANQLEEIRQYLKGKFPQDFEEVSKGGVIRPKGMQP